MSILVDRNTRVICQGFTGSQGTLHCEQAIAYGTQLVGGVTPGKGGATHLGLPVFDTVATAVEATGATASVIYVPAPFCKDSILEALDAGIELIVCITEGVPTLDMLTVKARLDITGARLIGPNCPGVITPDECKIGIMPGEIPLPRQSRHRLALRHAHLRGRQADHRPGDSARAPASASAATPFPAASSPTSWPSSKKTRAPRRSSWSAKSAARRKRRRQPSSASTSPKPVVAYIAGVTAPPGKRMGHAGAIVAGGKGTAAEKFEALEAAGVKTVRSLAGIGDALAEVTGWA